MHYQRLHNHGSTESPRRTLLERFTKRYEVDVETACWNWTGASMVRGYGVIRIGRRNEGAHRASWLIHRGEIPSGAFVCHRCDNPRCVNPEHLFLGTSADNVADMDTKGRRRTVLPRLHGEQHPTSKLTEEAVLAIVTEGRAGVTMTSLAFRFGISEAQVRRILTGEHWSHLTGIEHPDAAQGRQR
jgi:hypothetical protein